MRAPAASKRRSATPAVLSARLCGDHVMLQAGADGTITASVDGHSANLGKYPLGLLERARALRAGLPLASLAGERQVDDPRSAEGQELVRLVRRLARHGLLEYRLGSPNGVAEAVVIEPQMADYWPQLPKLRASDRLVLSRFAYLRRRGQEMVLESPRAAALFRIGDPRIAATLASLARPRSLATLRRQNSYLGTDVLALLVDCRIIVKLDADCFEIPRAAEGDAHLVLWDFHDLVFHTRSTEGRQANPLGGLYPYADIIPPPPAIRPPWPGPAIALPSSAADPLTPLAKLLQQRHSTRDFDDRHPIHLAELSLLLNLTARVQAKWQSRLELGEAAVEVDYAARPYPSGGSAYELELYLTVAHCAGLDRGFYHYDADRHALVAIPARPLQIDAMLAAAEFAMDAAAAPQILITIAARFDRVSWKYSAIAYALILKHVGVLTQALYLAATAMELGGCAIGTCNIELFAQMTGIEFHIEGPVGQFAIGRLDPSKAERAELN
jgi:SagB-type dehydrogenase family enzyme